MTEYEVPEMITIKECARRTGLSYDLIRRLCQTGQIVHFRTGTKYLINYGKFIEFLNGGNVNE